MQNSILALLVLLSISACSNGELTRSKVTKLLAEKNHDHVVVKHFISKDGKGGNENEKGTKYLDNELIDYEAIRHIKSGWLGRSSVSSAEFLIKPTAKLMDYLYSHNKTDYKNRDGSLAGVGYNTVYPHIGDIVKVEVKGIRADATDVNKKIAEIEYTVTANKLGKIFYPETFTFPYFAEFVLYDDGWRFEKTLWDLANSKSSFVKEDLYGLYSEEKLNGAILWSMHKVGIYSLDWNKLAKQVEGSKDYWNIGSAAWAYHDNGDTEKGIGLYKNKVMVGVRKTGDPEKISKFEKYFETMKNAEPLLQKLAVENEVKRIEFSVWQDSVEQAKKQKAEKQRKRDEVRAIKKQEAEKRRKLVKEKREAEKIEATRIKKLKEKSKVQSTSFGKFNCLANNGFRVAERTIEVTDVSIKVSKNNATCGDSNLKYELEKFFLDMMGEVVKDNCSDPRGKRMPCVGMKKEGVRYTRESVMFANESDRSAYFSALKKSLQAWRVKYPDLAK